MIFPGVPSFFQVFQVQWENCQYFNFSISLVLVRFELNVPRMVDLPDYGHIVTTRRLWNIRGTALTR